MKRLRSWPPILALIMACALPAQSPENYKTPYDDWVRNAARLERDALLARDRLAVRTDLAAANAAKYETARKAFFDAQGAQMKAAAGRIAPLSPVLESSADDVAKDYVSAQDAVLAKSIGTFANDPDEGIQRLRRALDKERNALAAVHSTMESRVTATDAVRFANDAVQRAAASADEQIQKISDSFTESAREASALAEAWPVYYRALSNGARGISSPGPAPVSTNRAPSGQPSSTTPQSAPSASPRVISAVPLARYTGAWEYLKGVSTFTKGLPPTMFNVVVKFENGQLSGTVSAAFDVLPNADPSVNFTFFGPLDPGREQSFPLETAEGAKGRVDLIPASAFNLLEVHFKLENARGKVAEADVVLIKKL
jgi:hypothetical protein